MVCFFSRKPLLYEKMFVNLQPEKEKTNHKTHVTQKKDIAEETDT